MSSGSIPKVFISYAWTSPEYQNKVYELAQNLTRDHVETIFDLEDLPPGADLNFFMEQLAEKDIKVIILCNKTYADKANTRQGGVGIETYLITAEIYNHNPLQQEQRFVPVVLEKDDQGVAHRPNYIKGRKYIDLTPDDPDGYEALLRWIHNAPKYIKMPPGPMPSFLKENQAVSVGSYSKYRRATNALEQGQAHALGLCEDYFFDFVDKMSVMDIENYSEESILLGIHDLKAGRDELLDVILKMFQYGDCDRSITLIKDFLGSLFQFASKRNKIRNDRDHFCFLLHELFIYCLAILLKRDLFNCISTLLEPFYRAGGEYDTAPYNYEEFWSRSRALMTLDEKQSQTYRRLSCEADLFKERADNRHITFDHFMQADLVLHLIGRLSRQCSHEID